MSTTTADQVRKERKSTDWGKLALGVLMMIPFAFGYAVRMLCRALWWGFATLWAAAVVGWIAAGGKR